MASAASLELARLALERVCEKLLSPSAEALEDCLPLLEEAVRHAGAGGAGDAAFGRTLRQTAALLESAGRFYAARVAQRTAAVYTPSGALEAEAPGGRLSLRA